MIALPVPGPALVELLDALRDTWRDEAVVPKGFSLDEDLRGKTHSYDNLDNVERAIDRCRDLILTRPSLLADFPDGYLDVRRTAFASLPPSAAGHKALGRLAAAGNLDERLAAIEAAAACPEPAVVRALLDLATPSPVPTERSSPRVHRAWRLHQEAVAAIGRLFRSARSDDMRFHLLLLRFLEEHASWRSTLLRHTLVDEALADFPANLLAFRCLVAGQVRVCLWMEDREECLSINGILLPYYRLFEMLNVWLRALDAKPR